MEIDAKKIENLIQWLGLLQVELKSIYGEIYSLLPETQKLDKKKKKQDLDNHMRNVLIKTAKIKS